MLLLLLHRILPVDPPASPAFLPPLAVSPCPLPVDPLLPLFPLLTLLLLLFPIESCQLILPLPLLTCLLLVFPLVPCQLIPCSLCFPCLLCSSCCFYLPPFQIDSPLPFATHAYCAPLAVSIASRHLVTLLPSASPASLTPRQLIPLLPSATCLLCSSS
jgi:hypothetical protein